MRRPNKSFSPWVFVTYGCSCKCPYCMIPEMGDKPGCSQMMSKETFVKMLTITEKIFEQGTYDSAHFRLSGGEPFLNFNMFKDLVVEYKEKWPGKMNFGLLTNLVTFTDEMAQWMVDNNIGMQVSLDDLVMSKPLNNGKSSSELVLANIEKAKQYGIRFTINSVIDINNTTNIKPLTDYVCKLDREYGISNWGLNGSYTLDSDERLEEIIELFKDCVLRLWVNGFDIYGKLRFYNSILNQKNGTCTAGIDSFGLGTNLEIWSCQSLCDQKPLGYFDENFAEMFKTNPDNAYFYNSTLRKECTFCPIIEYCRGGCRATHHDDAIMKNTCRIRQEITQFILNHIPRQQYNRGNGYGNNMNCAYYNGRQNKDQNKCRCGCKDEDHECGGENCECEKEVAKIEAKPSAIETTLTDYIASVDQEVETPPF